MADLVWHDFLEIGVEFIDQDHKHMLAIMQGVQGAIIRKDYAECAKLLASLLVEAAEHFQREEAYLAEARYPGLAEHKKYHAELLTQADNVKKICESTEAGHDVQDCFNGMSRFLIDDILKGDVRFKSYLEHEGLIRNAGPSLGLFRSSTKA
jgi:hemerythrin